MKHYTDKELKRMTPEELEAIQKQAIQEFADAGNKLELLVDQNKKDEQQG